MNAVLTLTLFLCRLLLAAEPYEGGNGIYSLEYDFAYDMGGEYVWDRIATTEIVDMTDYETFVERGHSSIDHSSVLQYYTSNEKPETADSGIGMGGNFISLDPSKFDFDSVMAPINNISITGTWDKKRRESATVNLIGQFDPLFFNDMNVLLGVQLSPRQFVILLMTFISLEHGILIPSDAEYLSMNMLLASLRKMVAVFRQRHNQFPYHLFNKHFPRFLRPFVRENARKLSLMIKRIDYAHPFKGMQRFDDTNEDAAIDKLKSVLAGNGADLYGGEEETFQAAITLLQTGDLSTMTPPKCMQTRTRATTCRPLLHAVKQKTRSRQKVILWDAIMYVCHFVGSDGIMRPREKMKFASMYQPRSNVCLFSLMRTIAVVLSISFACRTLLASEQYPESYEYSEDCVMSDGFVDQYVDFDSCLVSQDDDYWDGMEDFAERKEVDYEIFVERGHSSIDHSSVLIYREPLNQRQTARPVQIWHTYEPKKATNEPYEQRDIHTITTTRLPPEEYCDKIHGYDKTFFTDMSNLVGVQLGHRKILILFIIFMNRKLSIPYQSDSRPHYSSMDVQCSCLRKMVAVYREKSNTFPYHLFDKEYPAYLRLLAQQNADLLAKMAREEDLGNKSMSNMKYSEDTDEEKAVKKLKQLLTAKGLPQMSDDEAIVKVSHYLRAGNWDAPARKTAPRLLLTPAVKDLNRCNQKVKFWDSLMYSCRVLAAKDSQQQ